MEFIFSKCRHRISVRQHFGNAEKNASLICTHELKPILWVTFVVLTHAVMETDLSELLRAELALCRHLAAEDCSKKNQVFSRDAETERVLHHLVHGLALAGSHVSSCEPSIRLQSPPHSCATGASHLP